MIVVVAKVSFNEQLGVPELEAVEEDARERVVQVGGVCAPNHVETGRKNEQKEDQEWKHQDRNQKPAIYLSKIFLTLSCYNLT